MCPRVVTYLYTCAVTADCSSRLLLYAALCQPGSWGSERAASGRFREPAGRVVERRRRRVVEGNLDWRVVVSVRWGPRVPPRKEDRACDRLVPAVPVLGGVEQDREAGPNGQLIRKSDDLTGGRVDRVLEEQVDARVVLGDRDQKSGFVVEEDGLPGGVRQGDLEHVSLDEDAGARAAGQLAAISGHARRSSARRGQRRCDAGDHDGRNGPRHA